MTKQERFEKIKQEIKIAEGDLIHGPFCGADIHSDIYELSNGRKVQLQVTIEADEDEFENPTKPFRK